MNKMVFDTEDKEGKKLFNAFLEVLIEFNLKSTTEFNDIHIYQEEALIILEWEQIPFSREWGGRFTYVDEDQVVYTEYRLPDNSYVQLPSDENFDEYLNGWLKENPGWVKTFYGTWTNEIENAKFQEEYERQLKETSDLTGHDWVVNDVDIIDDEKLGDTFKEDEE